MLDASRNVMDSFPDDIRLLPNLVFINMSNNQLPELPAINGNSIKVRKNHEISVKFH